MAVYNVQHAIRRADRIDWVLLSINAAPIFNGAGEMGRTIEVAARSRT
jgi:hypothetical protein